MVMLASVNYTEYPLCFKFLVIILVVKLLIKLVSLIIILITLTQISQLAYLDKVWLFKYFVIM